MQMQRIIDRYIDEDEELRLEFDGDEFVIIYNKNNKSEIVERFADEELAIKAYLRIIELSNEEEK